jgi:hypothetical protein
MKDFAGEEAAAKLDLLSYAQLIHVSNVMLGGRDEAQREREMHTTSSLPSSLSGVDTSDTGVDGTQAHQVRELLELEDDKLATAVFAQSDNFAKLRK